MADMPNMEKSTESLSSEGEETNGGNLIRDSTGQSIINPASSPAISEEKVLPHYLRASTGSCHDLCKYGRKHALESKGKHPVYLSVLKNDSTRTKGDRMWNSNEKQRPLAKLLTQPASPDAKLSSVKGSRNQKNLMKMSASHDLRGVSMGDPYNKMRSLVETVGNEPGKQFSSLSLLVSPRHGNANLRQKVSSRTHATSKPKEKAASLETPASKPGPVPKPRPSNLLRDRRREAIRETIFKDIGISEIKETREVDLSTRSLSPPSQDRGLAALTPTKYRSKRTSAVSQPLKFESSSKSLLASKNKPMVTKVPTWNSWGNSEKRSERAKAPKDTAPTKGKKEVKPSGSLSLNSHPPRLVRLGSKKYRSTKNGQHDHGEIGSRKNVGLSDRNKGRLRSSSISTLETKENTPEKLKFRRGRVLNAQAENSGSMWLRFKQGRAIENQDSKVEGGRRSFRRKTKAQTNGSDSPATPAVVLRHQDVQVKKDTQDFNQVIEETANKLVETRKSKVKALVGAFESIISLQDSKPAIGC
ncbi:uncharacterized protein LOC116258104 [Nymphaea colorata]|nr:uncharacterized protein LOC116258104 [Nymphaea colorata]XP_031491084.1 uncharacterized protein LOC116258104 [Nymphaea colorata]XP_031491085.1 uncharacterized protein LOC116258104 [Nymphaea colorata]